MLDKPCSVTVRVNGRYRSFVDTDLSSKALPPALLKLRIEGLEQRGAFLLLDQVEGKHRT